MTEDEIRAEIAEMRRLATEAARPFREREDYLQKLLKGPLVTPVLHYKYRWRPQTEACHGQTLVEAFHRADGLIEVDAGYPSGVSVGGAMITWDEWKDDPRRPRNEEWIYVDV